MGQNQTRCQVRIAGQTIEEIKDFGYRSDALAVGDEAHFTAANVRRKYTGALIEGQDVEFLLSNPLVNGGEWTTKHTGLITVRDQTGDPSAGSVVKVTSADLGFHLQNNSAPLWFNLRKAKFIDLIDPSRTFRDRRGLEIAFIDQSWGIKGYRVSDNELNRLIKSGLRQGVAAAQASAQKVLDPVFAIQVDPGDTVYDVISTYARRINALVNVTVDKYLQVWRPNYARKPAYKFRNVAGGKDNNVLRYQMHSELRGKYTQVEAVGNQVGYEGPQDPNNPNATKKRGAIYHPDLLPFLRRLTFADGQMFAKGLAQKAAEWRYKRELFGSWYVTYVVEGHHQNGVWYEADQICDVEDDDLGLSGNFYVAACDYAVSKTDGDTTTVTIRLPGLLTAAFGVLPNAPTVKSLSKETINGKVQETRP